MKKNQTLLEMCYKAHEHSAVEIYADTTDNEQHAWQCYTWRSRKLAYLGDCLEACPTVFIEHANKSIANWKWYTYTSQADYLRDFPEDELWNEKEIEITVIIIECPSSITI